jgi:ribosomal protein L20
MAKAGIELDRKTLAEMAVNDADAFKKLVGLAAAAG